MNGQIYNIYCLSGVKAKIENSRVMENLNLAEKEQEREEVQELEVQIDRLILKNQQYFLEKH